MKSFVYGLLILFCGCVSAGKGSRRGRVPKSSKPVMVSVSAIAAVNPIVILLIGEDIRWGENIGDEPDSREVGCNLAKLAPSYESRLKHICMQLYSLSTRPASSVGAVESTQSLLEIFKAIAFHMHGYGGVEEFINIRIDDLKTIMDTAKASSDFELDAKFL